MWRRVSLPSSARSRNMTGISPETAIPCPGAWAIWRSFPTPPLTIPTNPISTRTKDADGSVSERIVLNGNLITLRFAPDSERELSAETMENVRGMLFREVSESGKLANQPANRDNEYAAH